MQPRALARDHHCCGARSAADRRSGAKPARGSLSFQRIPRLRATSRLRCSRSAHACSSARRYSMQAARDTVRRQRHTRLTYRHLPSGVRPSCVQCPDKSRTRTASRWHKDVRTCRRQLRGTRRAEKLSYIRLLPGIASLLPGGTARVRLALADFIVSCSGCARRSGFYQWLWFERRNVGFGATG